MTFPVIFEPLSIFAIAVSCPLKSILPISAAALDNLKLPLSVNNISEVTSPLKVLFIFAIAIDDDSIVPLKILFAPFKFSCEARVLPSIILFPSKLTVPLI